MLEAAKVAASQACKASVIGVFILYWPTSRLGQAVWTDPLWLMAS
jgi:hypothetical protein